MAIALVSAARGIGDLIRITPLVQVCARLGYEVDVLMAPDYLDSIALFEGSTAIRRLLFTPSPWSRERGERLDGLTREAYDVATFTVWSQPLRGRVHAKRVLTFDRQEWLRGGDMVCAGRLARALGWVEPMPAPFAMTSGRRFDLPSGTVALHPGCKPDWPWKKWHGFADLAAALPNVAVVGTPADLQNGGTYFDREFVWPSHVRNYIATLGLRDTAALLQQSAALVSNDSGLMHLGVALGTPTFGIFGITSPEREAIPTSSMHAFTKGLPCEPACRTRSWGRRDCEHHLECLKSLTAGDVLSRIAEAGVVTGCDARVQLESVTVR